MITAENQDSTSPPPWWTLAQMLVWILQQVVLPPQDAEQFCNELKPRTIEVAFNALVGALFNALCGAVEGMPIVAARIRCGPRYEDLATFFQPLPSQSALDALRYDLRQFIRQQPNIQFNPTWGRWTWPVCVSAAQVAPTPTRPTESAVADGAEPIPGSEVGSEKSQPPNKPDSVDASTPATRATPAGPARIINVGYVDPAIAHALAHAIKRARSARPAEPEPVPPTESRRVVPVPPSEPARAVTAVTETAASSPKKRRGKTGRRPEKRDAAAKRMRADLRNQRLTPDDLRNMKQLALAKEYKCGRETACEARDVVLSEIVGNCRK
jgi:hypothetical protein